MRIDHQRLIASTEYQEIMADHLSTLPEGESSVMTVVHEGDSSCCHSESWPVTFARVLDLARSRRGLSSLVVSPIPSGRIEQPK